MKIGEGKFDADKKPGHIYDNGFRMILFFFK